MPAKAGIQKKEPANAVAFSPAIYNLFVYCLSVLTGNRWLQCTGSYTIMPGLEEPRGSCSISPVHTY